MRFQTNLVRRGTQFYYRGRVPADLKDHYGKTEIFLSLRTADKQKADFALIQLKFQLFTEYAKLRGSDHSLPATAPEIIANVIDVPLESSSNLSETILSSEIVIPAVETQNVPELTIANLIEYWQTQSEKRPRTLMEVNTARKRLENLTGHNIANQIEKKDVIGFKDKLLADGLSFATIQKQINLLKAAFEVAVNNDLISKNPFLGVKLVKPKVIQKPRIPFSSEDLQKIFNSPVFSQGFRPIGGAGEASKWLPTIALWTGMRLEEIGQLLVSDIQSENGIYYFNISAESDSEKQLKTSSSIRRVPIHPEIICAGFLVYVDQIKLSGSGRLFPKLVSAGHRQLTASFSQWFSGYLRKTIGITDKRKSFHSFRHGFKDVCRLNEISKDIHDMLTGHASLDIGDGYGGDYYPLMPLFVAIKNINFVIN